MEKKTFKDYVFGTIQGIILIGVSLVGTTWMYRNMFNSFREED